MFYLRSGSFCFPLPSLSLFLSRSLHLPSIHFPTYGLFSIFYFHRPSLTYFFVFYTHCFIFCSLLSLHYTSLILFLLLIFSSYITHSSSFHSQLFLRLYSFIVKIYIFNILLFTASNSLSSICYCVCNPINYYINFFLPVLSYLSFIFFSSLSLPIIFLPLLFLFLFLLYYHFVFFIYTFIISFLRPFILFLSSLLPSVFPTITSLDSLHLPFFLSSLHPPSLPFSLSHPSLTSLPLFLPPSSLPSLFPILPPS